MQPNYKKDLKKLTKKQLIERVLIDIEHSAILATNLNRLDKELQKAESLNDSRHKDTEDLESTISRLRGLLKSYKELSERGCEESIEKMAEKLHDFFVKRLMINLKALEDSGEIKILSNFSILDWNHSNNEEGKDTYRVHITKIITKDCQD